MTVATSSVKHIGHSWNARKVVTFHGQRDTHIHTGEDYATTTLADIFTMQPDKADKGEGPAFIPSSYSGHDARNHAVQREKGIFAALTGDVDSGNHPLERIEAIAREFAGDAAWLIYSSAHAHPGDMRWRIVIPLADCLDYEEWHDAQHAFFNYMEFAGVEVDRALDRAGQPVYLPNVPAKHAKTGEDLRDEWGEALYYQRATSGTQAPGISAKDGPLAAGMEAIRRKREDDEREREKIRREAEAKRAARPQTEGAPIIADFNSGNSLATLLELYGYKQSQRNRDDWRSPHQQGESYATRIIGDKWVSLSMSDASARIGDTFPSGCYGDAYDLFVHYEHGGDHKAAFRTLYQERRSSQQQGVLRANEALFDPETGEILDGPPPMSEDDYAGMADGDDPPLEKPAPESQGDTLAVFHPADWAGTKPPERIWRWRDFVPDLQATLLTGAGATGKSLVMQQMTTCVAMGVPFLGIATLQCPSLYITCEDDLAELHRRQDAICESLAIPLKDTRGKLHLLSLQGRLGNELATFDGDGKMAVGDRFREIVATCRALNIRHVTIDNTAHTFAGNENDRHQVAAFVNLNNALAQAIEGSVIMVGHPNKAGDSYSGSTAWENQVRSRLYLEVPKNGEEGVPIDPDMRVLRNEKANYSRRGAEVTCYWLKGAFVTEDQMPKGSEREVREAALAGYENKMFMKLLDDLSAQKRAVSHSPYSRTFAPKIMAGMPGAKGLSKDALALAMERLFMLDQLAAEQELWLGKDRHPVIGLARKEVRVSAGDI